MRSATRTALREYFGFDRFKDNQEEIVETILTGRDVFAAMPTGGGKSLCYQLPSLLLPGLTLVVSPLIALMKDQVDAARLIGIPADAMHSSMDEEESSAVYSRVVSGHTRLLYVAPERFGYAGFLQLLSRRDVSLIAVDEAHCISEWGHEFRPDYLELSSLRESFPDTPIAAFTATATLAVQTDIISLLKLSDPHIVRASFDRPELIYRVLPKRDVRNQILEFIQSQPKQPGIVYRSTRKEAEATAEYLSGNGVRALPYHAGLAAAVRHDHQEQFKNDRVEVISATIAFGMGIDKPNIRFVVHGDLPRSIEGYYQETGRAGRDGEKAECLLLYGAGDIARVRYHIDRMSDQKERERAVGNLSRMAAFARSNACRREQILRFFDEEFTPPCRCCDVCRGEVQTEEAGVEAQKLLSAVVRTGERFGAHYVVDVVRGSGSSRIRDNGHDRLPTYGVGADREKGYWLTVTDELVAQGCLYRDPERRGALRITERGTEVLFARREFRVTRHSRAPHAAPPSERRQVDEVLLERLKDLRTRIARKMKRPPYMVFSDRTLRDMCAIMPESDTEMLQVHGVGRKKLDLFGREFMEVIAEHVAAVSAKNG